MALTQVQSGMLGAMTNINSGAGAGLTIQSNNATAITVDLNQNVTTTRGVYAANTFTGSYTDGIVMDYQTGQGRISVGTADGIGFYNGGPANTQIASLGTDGSLNVPNTFGFKNRIINGAMNVWQRGTSFTNPTASGSFYTADRWGVNRNSDYLGATVSQSTSAPTGFQYSLKLQRTAGDANTQGLYLYNSNETANVIDLAGQSVTLSFWVKTGANYSGGALTVQLYNGTGTDQRVYNYTGLNTVINSATNITSTWTRYSFTGTVPSNSTELGFFVFWNPTGTAGADDSIYITGCQLEKGTVATSFDFRPYGTELALCQRYYEVMNAQIDTAQNGSSYSYATWFFKVTKRSAPTITLAAGSTVGGTNYTSVDGYQGYTSASALRVATGTTASIEL